MFFHKDKKVAFLLPPKTGTHTLIDFLPKCGFYPLPPMHRKFDWFVNKYPNLNNYTVYAFMREPMAYFESAFRHMRRVIPPDGELAKIDFQSYEQMIEHFPALQREANIFTKPQSHWLADPRLTLLDFNNFEIELRRITGNTDQPIPKLNVADEWRGVITPAVEEFVRQHYADDYALAKDRLGKEY